ncbi:undecaprenyl diphosphate synthase [Verrucomicrobium sp. GAS474]|uniref:isoprenyl transferase n=1 Tax=Verrucomicrobium sp. GAS474 TaxID=1882831 RepID=UPI000879D0BF|nr:isoprenyl transferase [Verrucomicrobium sp. GAS474]SDU24163.1 undecaprenyl diphosphate synthase [Verrucomicrobium sp. GAS474]
MASAPEKSKIPRHVALIMDGNGRWARSRKMLRAMGHREGVESVREIVRVGSEVGVEFLTLYAFSVENWQRPAAEVATLMRFLESFLKNEVPELHRNNVRLHAIGRLNDLPKRVQAQLHKSIEATKENTGLTLILALSYGGRVEIVEAVRSLIREVQEGRLDAAQIDENAFSHHLYTRYYPDPDLLIRTSGEMRLSNFLLWQLSYTEIYVTKTLWPDFRRAEFLAALADYAGRQRRFGKV